MDFIYSNVVSSDSIEQWVVKPPKEHALILKLENMFVCNKAAEENTRFVRTLMYAPS
jgi:hypothetical protein